MTTVGARRALLWVALGVAGCPAPPPPQDKAPRQLEVVPDPDGPTGVSDDPSLKPRPVGDLTAPWDVAEPPADALEGPAGLRYRVLDPGYGKNPPSRFDVVTVNYAGWKSSGELFDSTYEGGQALTQPVHLMLPGFKHALDSMVEGARWRTWIPEALAYLGEPNTPRGTLVYELQLMRIDRKAQPPPAPPDLGRPPPDAETRPSGLVTKVLRQGQGARRPTPQEQVEVIYTGWNSRGEAIESTVPRGRPAIFPVSGLVSGWTEALQLMVVGEKRRLWLSQRLGYKGAAADRGTLVFDIELVNILPPPTIGGMTPEPAKNVVQP